ncbi:hypothetical protein ACROYT_G023949 [Oculina patagonica]
MADSNKQNTADETIQVELKDEDKKSQGCCGADMWYSPKGKSVPCVICLIFTYIIFLPFIIIFAFSVALWWCLSTIYIKMFRTGMPSTNIDA